MSRRSFTIEKKMDILRWHERNGSSVHKTATEFQLDRKCLRDWIKKKNVLEMNQFGKNKKIRKIGSGRKPLSEEMDEELFEFLEKERKAGRAVMNKLLAEQAVRIGSKYGLKDFKATSQYIANFKRRFNVAMRVGTMESQKNPVDLTEEIICVPELSNKVIGRHRIDVKICAGPELDQIYEDCIKTGVGDDLVQERSSEIVNLSDSMEFVRNVAFPVPKKIKVLPSNEGPYTIETDDLNCFEFIKQMKTLYEICETMKCLPPDISSALINFQQQQIKKEAS